MAKYRVKAGHEQDCVCTSAPEHRKGNGRFELSKCTQRDLRYLYDVVKCPYVFSPIGGRENGNRKFWQWGADSLFPYALAAMSRCSTPHRRIINDKADYISGKGITTDDKQPELTAFENKVNGAGEGLRQVLNKLAFDKSLFGNAFLAVITDKAHSFLPEYDPQRNIHKTTNLKGGIINLR